MSTRKQVAETLSTALFPQFGGTVPRKVTDEVMELLAGAWQAGFKQGGPMHDVNYDDPDAHTRNPYRKEG